MPKKRGAAESQPTGQPTYKISDGPRWLDLGRPTELRVYVPGKRGVRKVILTAQEVKQVKGWKTIQDYNGMLADGRRVRGRFRGRRSKKYGRGTMFTEDD